MGRQTGVVVAGFLALHAALIIGMVSVGTPYWVEGPTYNSSGHANVTDNSTTQGLWQKCVEGDCDSIVGQDLPDWFHAVQGLTMCGVLLCFSALVQDYVFFMSDRFRGSKILNASICLDSTLAGACWLSGIVVFAVKAPDSVPGLLLPHVLGWSFWVGVVAAIVSIFSAMSQLREACLLRQMRQAYEDL